MSKWQASEIRRGITVAREQKAHKRVGPRVRFDDWSPFAQGYWWTMGYKVRP